MFYLIFYIFIFDLLLIRLFWRWSLWGFFNQLTIIYLILNFFKDLLRPLRIIFRIQCSFVLFIFGLIHWFIINYCLLLENWFRSSSSTFCICCLWTITKNCFRSIFSRLILLKYLNLILQSSLLLSCYLSCIFWCEFWVLIRYCILINYAHKIFLREHLINWVWFLLFRCIVQELRQLLVWIYIPLRLILPTCTLYALCLHKASSIPANPFFIWFVIN